MQDISGCMPFGSYRETLSNFIIEFPKQHFKHLAADEHATDYSSCHSTYIFSRCIHK